MFNNKETFKMSNNPIEFNGVVGSLSYFLTNITLIFIRTKLLELFCSQSLSNLSDKQLVSSQNPIDVLLKLSPANEVVAFIFLAISFSLLVFILNKKRILDIIGNEQNALKTAVRVSLFLLILEIFSIFFTPDDSLLNKFLTLCMVIIFMMKGKITNSSPG